MNDLKFLKTALGKKIKTIRTGQKLTMKALGQRSNLAAWQISRIERGVANPYISRIALIARALDISIPEIFNLNEVETPGAV